MHGLSGSLLLLSVSLETISVLQQRLSAMQVPPLKRLRVYDDLIRFLFAPTISPVAMPTDVQVMRLFVRAVHSTIFRMNATSRDKLFRLMLMCVKFRLFSHLSPRHVVQQLVLTLCQIKTLASDAKLLKTLDDLLDSLRDSLARLTLGECYRIRCDMLGFVQEKRHRVSVLLRENEQNRDGSYVVHVHGCVAEQPGTIRLFDESGNIRATRTVNVARPKETGAGKALNQCLAMEYEDSKRKRETTKIFAWGTGAAAVTAAAGPQTAAAGDSVAAAPHHLVAGALLQHTSSSSTLPHQNHSLQNQNHLEKLVPTLVLPLLGRSIQSVVFTRDSAHGVALGDESEFVFWTSLPASGSAQSVASPHITSPTSSTAAAAGATAATTTGSPLANAPATRPPASGAAAPLSPTSIARHSSGAIRPISGPATDQQQTPIVSTSTSHHQAPPLPLQQLQHQDSLIQISFPDSPDPMTDSLRNISIAQDTTPQRAASAPPPTPPPPSASGSAPGAGDSNSSAAVAPPPPPPLPLSPEEAIFDPTQILDAANPMFQGPRTVSRERMHPAQPASQPERDKSKDKEKEKEKDKERKLTLTGSRGGMFHHAQTVFGPIVSFVPNHALHGQRIVQIVAGETFLLARSETHEVYSLGMGKFGELGLGNGTVESGHPRPIAALRDKSVVHLSAGRHRAAAVTADGTVFTWGRSFQGQPVWTPTLVAGLPEPIMALACGEDHIVAITTTGRLVAWGMNRFSQCGWMDTPAEGDMGNSNGSNLPPSSSDPYLVASPQYVAWKPSKGKEKEFVSSGTGTAMSGNGQSGTVTTRIEGRLRQHLEAGESVETDSDDHTREDPDNDDDDDDDDLLSSRSSSSQSSKSSPRHRHERRHGDRNSTAAQYDSRGEEMARMGSRVHANVAAAASQHQSQHRRGQSHHQHQEFETLQRNGSDASHEVFCGVAAGTRFSLALTEDGSVFAFGSTEMGQLGLGPIDDAFVAYPTRIARLPPIQEVVCGNHHALALTKTGSVFSWGAGAHGALGNGDRGNQNAPSRIHFFRGEVRSISAAGDASAAVVPHKFSVTLPWAVVVPPKKPSGTALDGSAMQHAAGGAGGAASAASMMMASEEIPNAFVCPITCDLLVDPHFAADGHTYERVGIQAWLAEHSTSPMTGAVLDSTELIPNKTLRAQIESWRSSLATAAAAAGGGALTSSSRAKPH